MTARSWQPSCSLRMLQVRAAMLQAARATFQQLGYLEVETPCLSRDIVIDAWLEPFSLNTDHDRWFLQTSPEAFMKRLIAAGSGSIFQISRVFRRGETGARHNPEFTMIEWYGIETTWEQQLEVTELLVRNAVKAGQAVLCESHGRWSEQPFRRATYADAFHRSLGIRPSEVDEESLLQVARQHGLSCQSETPSRDDLLNFLLAACIEPTLGIELGSESPEFLCDYPASQAALACVADDNPTIARRFELYIRGIELCNGYQELTDAEELARREQTGNTHRHDIGQTTLPGAPLLKSAMESGLPSCSGVALGFDRLVMIAAGTDQISEVLPFPESRC